MTSADCRVLYSTSGLWNKQLSHRHLDLSSASNSLNVAPIPAQGSGCYQNSRPLPLTLVPQIKQVAAMAGDLDLNQPFPVSDSCVGRDTTTKARHNAAPYSTILQQSRTFRSRTHASALTPILPYRLPDPLISPCFCAAPVRLGMMSLILGRPKTSLGASPCAM